MKNPTPALALLFVVAACTSAPSRAPSTPTAAEPIPAEEVPPTLTTPGRLRLATFNVFELKATKLAEVDAAGVGLNVQLRSAATVIQRVAPDVFVLQEIDLPEGAGSESEALKRHAHEFGERYLATREPGAEEVPIRYPYLYVAPTNTGVLTGFDLNGDGVVASEADRGERRYGDDSYGFGTYPGQYSMAVFSKVPLLAAEARTFQLFRWVDLPGHHFRKVSSRRVRARS